MGCISLRHKGVKLSMIALSLVITACVVLEIMFWCVPYNNQIYDATCSASNTITSPDKCPSGYGASSHHYNELCTRIETTLGSELYNCTSNVVFYSTSDLIIDSYKNNSVVGCFVTANFNKCAFLTEGRISGAASIVITILTILAWIATIVFTIISFK